MAIDKIQSESINLADTFAFTGTVTGAGETNKPAFYATRSGAQSISNNTYTKLQVNTEVVDTNSAYDNSSNYRFTVPSGEAGLYSFTARSSLANVNDDQRGQIVLAVNGTRDSKTMHRDYSTGADQALYVGTTGIFNLSVGDYLYTDSSLSTPATIIFGVQTGSSATTTICSAGTSISGLNSEGGAGQIQTLPSCS